jgi:hypothetical protein
LVTQKIPYIALPAHLKNNFARVKLKSISLQRQQLGVQQKNRQAK